MYDLAAELILGGVTTKFTSYEPHPNAVPWPKRCVWTLVTLCRSVNCC
jgi:hypothetical protein